MRALKLLWDLVEDSTLFTDTQKGVVEVECVDVVGQYTQLGIGDAARRRVARFRFKRRIVAERVDADLVAKALVIQETGV